MKTALVTTAWLDNPEYKLRVEKFVRHYEPFFNEIFIIENGSKEVHFIKDAKILTQLPHLPRTALLEYPYLWRAIYSLGHFFSLGFNKVIYMDSDFFILNEKTMELTKSLLGWSTFYCLKHNFNETGIQVISKDCQEYEDFVLDGQFWKHNGKEMERTLPVTNVVTNLVGDRWSELGKTKQDDSWDFSAQTLTEMEVKWKW